MRIVKPAHNGETRAPPSVLIKKFYQIMVKYKNMKHVCKNKISLEGGVGNTVGSTSTNFCNFFHQKRMPIFLVYGAQIVIGGLVLLD